MRKSISKPLSLLVLCILALPLFLAAPSAAQSVELLQNGGFETGNFTGWQAITSAFTTIPWRVSGAGQSGGTGMQATQPQEGSWVAWNGFDGGGPMTFVLSQSATIPDNHVAALSWMHRIQWNFQTGRVATLPRTFDVLVRDATTGTVLETLFSYETGIQSTQPTGNTGWVSNTFDLSAYAGATVRIEFVEYIPQVLTGYGQFEIDAVSLTAEPAEEPDPPAASALSLDIRPWACPNPLNLRSRGLIPVAILGTADLDLQEIDPATIRLEGVAPKRHFHADVASPFLPEDEGDGCVECAKTVRDGYHDILLLFRTEELTAALRERYGDELNEVDCLNLELSAALYDGSVLSGKDSVKLVGRPPAKKPAPPKPSLKSIRKK